MRKLIIVAAIAFTATVSHAAAVCWNCMNAADFKGGNYSIFVIGINEVTSAAQIKELVAAGGLSSVSSYAFDKGEVSTSGTATKSNTTSGKEITYSGSGTDTYTAFIFVQNATGDKASFSANASITMENNSTSKTFAFNNQGTAFSSNSFTVNVPEPTSGLLLLLGMAGLTLKRKRA